MSEAFFNPSRIRFVMGGERAGKSFTGALQLVCRHQLGELFWLVAEEYETCVPEFDYCSDFLQELGLISKPQDQISYPREGSKRLITDDGVVIETRSASDYRKIAEKAPDAIVGCEVGRWQWQTYLRVNGRLAEKRGWAWLCGSFEGSLGWQAEKFRQWQGTNIEQARSFSVPSHTNIHVFPEGESDPEIIRLKESMPQDYFMERHMGVPVPPSGRVYREFEYVTHVSEDARYVPHRPVELWIDPGYGGAYAVLVVQNQGDIVNIVDEVYVQRLINDEVIALCQKKPWWKDVLPYGVIDIAGRQHASERSPAEAWMEQAGIHLDSHFVHINDGIARVRSFLRFDSILGRPGVLVSPRCLGLIAEMGAGKHPIEGMGVYKYKTDGFGNVLSEKPIEANNHACSALAYGLVARFGLVKRSTSPEPTNWRRKESFRGRSEESLEEAAARVLATQGKN